MAFFLSFLKPALNLFFFFFIASTSFSQVDEYAIKEVNGRFGLVNGLEEELISPVYDGLGWTTQKSKVPYNGTIGYKEGDRWGLK